jgi:hypothetical protein
MTQNRERGSITVEVIFAALLTVFATVLLVQLVMASYIQGVARAAADEGVRAGSRVAAGPTVCEERAAQVFASLLPGPSGNDATISCTMAGTDLISTVRVIVDSPTTGVPNFDITANGRAVQEQ